MGGPDKEGGAFDGAGLIPHQVIPCQIIPGHDDTLPYLSDFVLFSLFVDNVEVISIPEISALSSLATVPELLRFENLTRMGAPAG